MSVMKKLETIEEKLKALETLDPERKIFGAYRHQYRLNKVKTENELRKFEESYRIILPEGYREFLLKIGNGGAGPYYGIETLEDSLYVDLDYKRENELLNPAKSFLLTEAWNMEFEGDPDNEQEIEEYENLYFDDKWTDGLLRICNYGCGISLNIIVNGAEYGNIWVDDRGNDGGIYPDPYFDQTGRTQFLEWYEIWLDRSIEEAKAGA